jgi:DNA polymerase
LWQAATQTVFGAGRRRAPMMLVGEQPGHEEDVQGEPFVGPAGRILDQALVDAGIDRDDTYVTNVVKHFKWVAHGKRKLHQKPNSQEIRACLPWLDAEIEAIKPTVVICLGATAAQALLGPGFRVTRQRGQVLSTAYAPYTFATVHPSSILRQTTAEARHAEMESFVRDLAAAAKLLRQA